MAIQELSTSEIDALTGTRHALAGFAYPAIGLQPYYEWLVRTLHLLGEASAGGLKVNRDDQSNTGVLVTPGRATLAGVALAYAGETLDLASFNNDTAILWLYDDAGEAAVGVGSDAGGWPVVPHIKLAEVTLAAGQVTDILDRRLESLFSADLAPGAVAAAALADALADGLVTYALNAATQGSTSSPSTITIEARDAQGNPIGQVDYLRVRVCDEDGYSDATNATLAAGANTTVVQTVTTDKDLILKSHTDGTFELDLTNATAETVTLRIGPAALSSRRAEYTPTLDVTHA
jgi:hypothetical protein